MFGYYLNLAWCSLRRAPVLTGLMVLAIGLGIGASMTMITVLHVMSGDPLPERSQRLFYPTVDPRPLAEAGHDNADIKESTGHDAAVDNLTYVDVMALLKARRAVYQSAMAGGSALVQPADDASRVVPKYEAVHYVTHDFFPMFGVPFSQGAPWSNADDDRRARVAVIAPELKGRLFGAESALGKQIRVAGIPFEVVGVLAAWRPEPKFYEDVDSGVPYGSPDQVLIPFLTAIDLGLGINGTSCWGNDKLSGKALRTSGSCSWAQFWVQLDTPAQVSAYRHFVQGYAQTQHALGRFPRAQQARLYPMPEWLSRADWVPSDVHLQLLLALSFLGVCLLNIVALLLAKFLRRSGEIGVRRALGARRWDIFLQLGVESLLIGTFGGVLGLGIAQLGLWSVRRRPDDYAALASMDLRMLLLTLLMAVVASVLAGLLPAWRACRIAPAIQIKSA